MAPAPARSRFGAYLALPALIAGEPGLSRKSNRAGSTQPTRALRTPPQAGGPHEVAGETRRSELWHFLPTLFR